eukprot:g131.t1
MNFCNQQILLLCIVSLLTLCTSQRIRTEAESRELVRRHPYMAAIRNFNRFDCGAVLIDCHTILTAAQCVDERHGRDRLPELWLYPYHTESLRNSTLVRRAIDVRVHPNFTGDIVDGYDYAILSFNEPATDLIPIRTTSISDLREEAIQKLRLLGFGRSTRTSSRSPYLQISRLNRVNSAACKNSEELIFIEEQSLCLEGDTPCSGDHGGPVFIGETGSATGDTLVGIVSSTYCDLNSRLSSVASILHPDIFNWIIETVNELESPFSNSLEPSISEAEYFTNLLTQPTSIRAQDQVLRDVRDGRRC